MKNYVVAPFILRELRYYFKQAPRLVGIFVMVGLFCATGELPRVLINYRGANLQWLQPVSFVALLVNFLWPTVVCGVLAAGALGRERLSRTSEEMATSGIAPQLLYHAKLLVMLLVSFFGLLIVYATMAAVHSVVTSTLAVQPPKYEFLAVLNVFAYLNLLVVPWVIWSAWISAPVRSLVLRLLAYAALAVVGIMFVQVVMMVASSLVLSETDFLPARMDKQPFWQRVAVLPVSAALLAPLYYVLGRFARRSFERALAQS